MIQDELKYRILRALGFPPTPEQEMAVGVFTEFMLDSQPDVMILRGSAGTGKTTLAAAIVKAMVGLQQKITLMAPTGRAAKVFALYSGHEAMTIHRRIYRQKSAADMSSFSLNDNLYHDMLFIVDEASMIANGSSVIQTEFGSGCLLDDLMQYVYQGQNCRLLLIGDKAQLPPVGELESPALSASFMRGYGMRVYESSLNQVLRQSQESGILWNATMIRGVWSEECGVRLALPKIRFKGFADIQVVPGNELVESLATSYSRVGIDETIVVTRSNKRANIYNQGIRNMILDCESELCHGDQLMIVKNNYYWIQEAGGTSEESAEDSRDSGLSFIANGDRAVVQRVRHVRELFGFRFADVTMQLPDYDDFELTATVILDSISTEAPALTREQQQQLFEAVQEDYAYLTRKDERIKKLKSDPYYNALQIKFAYAVTCHKAQGGQWAHVYIDQGYMTDEMLTPDYIHWLYTAFTRATDKLFLVNWPESQKE